MSYTLSATSTSITFAVTHVAGKDYYRFFLRKTDDTENMIVDGAGQVSAEDFTYTVSNLEPGTSYTGNVYAHTAYGSTDGQVILGAQKIQTASASGRPGDWAWTSVGVKGAAIPSPAEGVFAPVSATDWNNFCARINAFRAYKSLAGATLGTVSPGGEILRSDLEAAMAAIQAIPGAGAVPTVCSPIEAAFWQQLAAALNSVS